MYLSKLDLMHSGNKTVNYFPIKSYLLHFRNVSVEFDAFIIFLSCKDINKQHVF